jgi:cystathionine beta-lyase
MESYEDLNRLYRYARYSNPTSHKFEEAMAELEGGFGAISAPSGLSAITTSVLAFAKAGSHLLVSDSIYPPTRDFFNNFVPRYGVQVEYYDPNIGAGIAQKIRKDTSLIYMESPGSATFDVMDVPAISSVAQKAGVTTIVDNSWSGGVLFRPLEHGVNISLQSATKYIGGHGDLMLGFAVADTEDHYKTLKATARDLGVFASPDNIVLALRGLRTMKLRLAQNEASAMRIAQWLESRPEIARVYYPALPSHPSHAIWKRDFSGCNGILCILLRPAPKAAVHAFVNSLKLFPVGSSWGGYESLLQPQFMERNRVTVPWTEKGAMLRLQIGLEDSQDLIEDLQRGLEIFSQHKETS